MALKRIFAILIILLVSATVKAQNHADSIRIFDRTIGDDVNYKGGEKRLNKVLIKNLSYPKQALKDSVSGTVYLYFEIDTLGHSENIQVLKGVREDIDQEAIRCVDLLDDWIPGKQNGKKIKLSWILPIRFDCTK